MKFTLKLFLAVCLFSSVTFADGDMTTGGFTGDMTTGGKACTENCAADDGQTGSSTTTTGANSDEPQDDGTVLTFIEEYLFLLFG